MASSAQIQSIFDLIPGNGSVILADYCRKDAAILRTIPKLVDHVVGVYTKSGYTVESAKGKHTDYYYIKVLWNKPKRK
jgi:hypothetical protein